MQVQPTNKLARHKPVPKHPGICYSERREGSKSFEVKYLGSDGKWRYETVGPRLDQAKARLAEVTYKQVRGDVIASATTTLADLLDGWRAGRNVKPRTEATQDMHVNLHIVKPLGRTKVRDINKAVIAQWLNGLKRQDGKPGPLSDGTKAGILQTLSSILDHAVDAEVIGSNPVKALDRKKKPRQGKPPERILREGELEVLLAASHRFPWLRPIIRTALLSAMRLGEVCGLDWRDIDFERDVIVVRQNFGKDGRLGTPKGGRVKEIPLLPELRSLLREHYMTARDKSPHAPVFVNKLGGRRRPSEVERAFAKARRYAGLSTEPRALTFHDLRHSTATRLANVPGAVLTEVQEFLRHESLMTTLLYVHPVKSEDRTARLAAALAGL